METLAFILGIFTVTTILVGMGMFMVAKQIINIKNNLRGIEYEISNFYTELDNRERNIYDQINDLSRNTNSEFDNIHRQLDSRLDKLEHKLTSK